MKTFSAAVIALLTSVAVAGPAFAQNIGSSESTPLQKQYAREKQDREMIEKDYDKAMQRLKKLPPAATASNDPWATVRPAAEAKTETKKK